MTGEEKFIHFMRSYRKKEKMSQSELALRSGITRAKIMHMEGRKQRIYLQDAINIVEVFNMEIQIVNKDKK